MSRCLSTSDAAKVTISKAAKVATFPLSLSATHLHLHPAPPIPLDYLLNHNAPSRYCPSTNQKLDGRTSPGTGRSWNLKPGCHSPVDSDPNRTINTATTTLASATSPCESVRADILEDGGGGGSVVRISTDSSTDDFSYDLLANMPSEYPHLQFQSPPRSPALDMDAQQRVKVPPQPAANLSYDDFLKSPTNLHRALHSLTTKGYFHLNSVPEPTSHAPPFVQSTDVHFAKLPAQPLPRDLPAWQIATLISSSPTPSHSSLYGPLFNVISSPNPTNIAYTNKELKAHQDLAYYESPPGIQILHCIESTCGGSSTLISALDAADYIQKHHPKLYHALTIYPVTFIKQRHDPNADSCIASSANLSYTAPLFMRDFVDGQTASLRWAPPFEGTLLYVPELWDDFIEGYRLMSTLMSGEYFMEWKEGGRGGKGEREREKYEWESEAEVWHRNNLISFHMEPGDAVVFNNRTLCHGRSAFEVKVGEGGRWLMGSYAGIDDVFNVYNVLSRKYGGGGGRVGNGSSSFVV